MRGDRKSPRNSGFNDLEPSPCVITGDGHLGPVALLHKAPGDLDSFLPCTLCSTMGFSFPHSDNLVTIPYTQLKQEEGRDCDREMHEGMCPEPGIRPHSREDCGDGLERRRSTRYDCSWGVRYPQASVEWGCLRVILN